MLPLQRTAFNNAATWKGGAGTWSATDKTKPDFKVGDGNRRNAWASNPTPLLTTVTFPAPAGVVVAQGVQFSALVFDADGYTLTGSLNSPGSFEIRVPDAEHTMEVAATITSSGAFNKYGPGTVVFSGPGIPGGSLNIGEGELRIHNSVTAFPVSIGAGGTIVFENQADVYLTGVIAGSGTIRKTGPGYLFVNGLNAGARDFVKPEDFIGTFDVPILNRPPVFTGAPSVVVCKAGMAKPVLFLITDPDGDSIASVTSGSTANGIVSGLSISGFSYTAANASTNQAIELTATDDLGATGNATVTAWNFSSSSIFVDTDGATGSYSAASDVVVLAGSATGVGPSRVTKWSPTLTGSSTFTFFCTQAPGEFPAGVALSGTFSGFTGTFQVGAPSLPSGCSISGVFMLGDPTAGVGANAFSSGANATFIGTASNRAQVFVTNMGGGSLTQSFRLGAYATAYFKAGAYAWTGSFTGTYGDFSNSSSTSYLLIRTDASVALSTSSAGVLCEWSVDTPTSAVAGTCTLPVNPDLSNFRFIARSAGSDSGGTFTKTVFSWTGAATGMPVIYHAGFNIAAPSLSGGKYYYALQSSADPALALTGVLDLTARTFALVRVS